MTLRKLSPLVLLAVVLFLSSGCGDDPAKPEDDPYLRGNTPDAILEDFTTAWRRQEVHEYARLLSDDFLFYFDPDTRAEKGLPEFWTKILDSTQVGRIFGSEEVTDIRLHLTYDGTPVADDRPGWSLINVTDETFEVDLTPQPGEQEGITLRVEGQLQKFHFRKGRTAADTLASSPTSQTYYIVEWRDMGLQFHTPADWDASEPITWGRIKSLYRSTFSSPGGGPAVRSTTWGGIKARH